MNQRQRLSEERERERERGIKERERQRKRDRYEGTQRGSACRQIAIGTVQGIRKRENS